MKRVVCWILVCIMLSTTAVSGAEAVAMRTEDFYAGLLTAVVNALMGKENLYVSVQDQTEQSVVDAAVITHGPGSPCGFVTLPGGRLAVDDEALYAELQQGTVGMQLSALLEELLKNATGIREIPQVDPDDGQVLMNVLETLAASLTERTFSVSETADGDRASLTLKASSKALQEELDACVRTILTEKSGELDPLLARYGEVIRLLIPQAPLSCDGLLNAWHALMESIPEHDFTLALTLSRAYDDWQLKGNVGDWNVDGSWSAERFHMEITPGEGLPEGTPSLKMDSDDLEKLALFAQDVFAGIGGDAVLMEQTKKHFLFRLDLYELLRQLGNSYDRCVDKYRPMLAELEENYALLLKPVAGTVFRVRSMLRLNWNSLLRMVQMYPVKVECEWKQAWMRSWQVNASVNSLKLYLTGDQTSVSGQLWQDAVRIGRYSTDAFNASFDLDWDNGGFVLQGVYRDAYTMENAKITGSYARDSFEIRALAGADMLDVTVQGDARSAVISGTFNRRPVSGQLDYNSAQAALSLVYDGRNVFNGLLESDDRQYTLAMDFPTMKESFRVAYATNHRDMQSLQVEVGEWHAAAQLHTTDGFGLNLVLPHASVDILMDKAVMQFNAECQIPGGRAVRTAGLELVAQPHRFDAVCTVNNLVYELRCHPGTLQAGWGRGSCIVEDVTALVEGCLNATSLVVLDQYRAPYNLRYTVVAHADGRNDGVLLRLYEGYPADGRLMGQASGGQRPLTAEVFASITPENWVDFDGFVAFLSGTETISAEEPTELAPENSAE